MATLQPTAVPSPTATAAPARTLVPAGLTTLSWIERPADFARGKATEVQLAADGVRLAKAGDRFVASGEYISEVRDAGFPFTNAVLSWAADTPEGTVLRFELRVKNGDAWTGWYAMGEWSRSGGRSFPNQEDGNGKVDVDTLKLDAQATALQYRVKLSTSAATASPLLKQVSVAYADMRKPLAGPAVSKPAGLPRDLDVPRISQLEQDPSVASLICSPTSLAMVMQYWGVKKPVPDVWQGVKDRSAGIYGNWVLNTAFAAASGLDARVERFYSMEQLEQQIAVGRPAIISIRFSPGELSGSPISSTDGHLIVVRGFNQDGDVIVNDPIAPNSGGVRRVYKRDQLAKIWLRSGGVVYLVSPPGS